MISVFFKSIFNFLSLIKTPYYPDMYEIEEENDAIMINNIPKLYKEKTISTMDTYLNKYNNQFNLLEDTVLINQEKKEIEEYKEKLYLNDYQYIKDKIHNCEEELGEKFEQYEMEVKIEQTALITQKKDLKISLNIKKKELNKLVENIKQFKKQLENIPDKTKEATLEIIKKRINKNTIIIDYVPNIGNIVFYYDITKESFCYYSDYTTNTLILDTLCKKYCIQIKIKELFLYVDVKNGEETILKPANRYTSLGKLSNYNFLKPVPKQKLNKKLNLSWKDFKDKKVV